MHIYKILPPPGKRGDDVDITEYQSRQELIMVFYAFEPF
jgi:hypothetical protein